MRVWATARYSGSFWLLALFALRAVFGYDEMSVRNGSRRLIESHNIVSNCNFKGKKVCCGMMDPNATPSYPRKRIAKVHNDDHGSCSVSKTYVPSAYEQKHIDQAEKWKDSHSYLEQLLDFMIDDIPHSKAWVERVAQLSQSSSDMVENEVDRNYMSYFNFTRVCTSSTGERISTNSWREYIEPLTVHMRHPFSIMVCKPAARFRQAANNLARRNENSDHVLVRSSAHIDDTIRFRGHETTSWPKRFFFDAGANVFLNGMAWFLCAYQQRGVIFDDLFGWEYEKWDATDFWSWVPPLVTPIYHFYNVAVLADNAPTTSHSVPRIIQSLAQPHDFVSFKLDIDTPAVELPIVQQLMSNPELYSLVDEFFFELHFQCEVMTKCGWTWPPDVVEGQRLDRYSAIRLFQDLRKLGIRSHVWP